MVYLRPKLDTFEGTATYGPKRLAADARERLRRYHWPGNVRELMNVLTRAVVWSKGRVIRAADLEGCAPKQAPETAAEETTLNRALDENFDLNAVLSEVARHYLERALLETGGNKSRAADLVGLPNHQTFANWMKRHKA